MGQATNEQLVQFFSANKLHGTFEQFVHAYSNDIRLASVVDKAIADPNSSIYTSTTFANPEQIETSTRLREGALQKQEKQREEEAIVAEEYVKEEQGKKKSTHEALMESMAAMNSGTIGAGATLVNTVKEIQKEEEEKKQERIDFKESLDTKEEKAAKQAYEEEMQNLVNSSIPQETEEPKPDATYNLLPEDKEEKPFISPLQSQAFEPESVTFENFTQQTLQLDKQVKENLKQKGITIPQSATMPYSAEKVEQVYDEEITPLIQGAEERFMQSDVVKQEMQRLKEDISAYTNGLVEEYNKQLSLVQTEEDYKILHDFFSKQLESQVNAYIEQSNAGLSTWMQEQFSAFIENDAVFRKEIIPVQQKYIAHIEQYKQADLLEDLRGRVSVAFSKEQDDLMADLRGDNGFFSYMAAANPNHAEAGINTTNQELSYTNLLLQRTENTLEAMRDGGNIGTGALDTASDVGTWNPLVDFAGQADIYRIAEKFDKGETLTENEEMLLEAATLYSSVQAASQGKISIGYKAGATTVQALQFIAEFALMPTGAIDNAIGRGLQKMALKMMGRKGYKALAKVGGKVTGNVFGKTALTIPKIALDAAEMTLTFGLPKIGKEYFDLKTGDIQYKYDENKNMTYSHREQEVPEGRELLNASLNVFGEYASEQLGYLFLPVKSKVEKRILMEMISDTPFGRIFMKLKPSDSFIGTVRQKLQVGGFTEENIEEWAKSFWDAALLDTVRVENEDGTKNWGKTLEKAGLNLDDMVDTAICLLPLQLLTFGAGVGVARAEHRTFQIGFNRLYDSLQTEAERQMFDAIRTELNTSGNLNIESLREQIKQTLTADTPKHILETAKSENWNQQQIDEATVNYKKGRILMLIDSYQDNFTDTFRQSQREVINKAAEETANTISNNKDGGHIYEARYVGEDGKVRKAYITQGKIEGTENEDGTFTVTGGSQRFGVVANGANGLAFREGAVTLSQLKEGTVVRLSNEKMIEMLTAQKLANVNQERTFVYDGNVYDTQSGILLGEEGSFDRTDSYSVNEEIRIKTPGGKYTQVHLVGDNITLREDGSINFELSPDLRVLVNGRLVDITNPEMQASINESLRAGYTRKKTGQGYYLQLHRHRGSETQVRYKENRGKLIQSLQDTENVEDEEEITMPVLQSKKNVPFKITLPSSGKIVSVNVVGDLTYKEDGTIDWANSTDAVIYVSDGKGSKAISGMRLEGTLDKFHQEQQKQRDEYEQAINVYREEQLAKYKARVERAEARARRRVDKRNALERIETIRQELQAKIDEDVKTTEEEVMHLREHQKPHPDRTYTFWNSHDKRITINGHPTNIRVTFPKNGVLSQYPSGAIRWDSAYSSSEVPIIEVMHYNQETKKNEWVALDTTTPNIEAQVRGLLDIKFMEQRMDAIEKNRIREANLQTKREEAEERKRKFKEEREALNNDAIAKAKAKQKDGKTLNIFETLLCMKDSDTTTTAATMLNDLIKATQFELEETKQTVTSESIKKQIKLAGELKAYTDFQQQYFPNSEQVEAQEEADTQAAIQEIVTEGGIEAEETTEIGAEEEIEMEDVEITLNDIEEDNKEIVVEEEEEQQSKEVKDERVGHFVDTDLDITSEDVDILYDGKGFKKGHIRIARKGEGTTKTWQPLKRFPMALYNGEQCVVLSKGDALSNRKNVSILMVDSKEVLNNIPLGRLEAIDSTQENPKPYFTEVQTNSQKTMSAINSIDTIDGLLNYTLFKLGDKKYSLFDIINVRSGKDMYKRLMGEVRGYIERTYPESKDKQDERYKAVRDDLKYNLDKIAKRWNIFVAESGVEAALLEAIDSELLMDNYEDMSIKDFLPKKYNETFEEYIDRLRGIVEQAGGSVSPMRINEAFSNINKESTGNAILSRVRQAFLLVQYLKELGHDISLSSSLEYEQAESEASIARQYEQQAGRGVEADQQEKPFISPAQQRAGQTLIDILKDSGIDTQVLNDAELDAVIEANPTGTPLTFSNGEVYGVRIGNVLYVSGERMNADTATHEYTHLWLYLLEMDSPKEVEKIIKTLKGSNTWNSVVRNPAFISKSDAAIASEVLARLTGQYWGAEVNGKVRIEVAIEEATRPTEEQNGLLKAIRNFWKWVMKKFEALSYIGNSVAKQDNAIQELVNRPIIDLLSRRNMKERLDERAMELAAEHNVPIVILHNLEEARNTQGIPADVIQGLESGEIAQGFMLPEDETQTVYIYMPFNTSLSDLEKTFAHEAMGHISLREFFGTERYDAVMLELYNQMSDKDKRMIQDRDKRFATADDETRQAIIAREVDEWLAENRESWKRVPIVSQAHDMLLPLFKKLGIWAEFSHHDLGKMFASSDKAFMTEEKKAQRTAQIAAAQEQQQNGNVRYSTRKRPDANDWQVSDKLAEEMAAIKEQAQANGTFMKAPNGEPTNLNERNWLLVRTQQFKDWFGDWETQAKATYLFENLPVVELDGTEFTPDGVKLTDKVPAFYQEQYNGKITRNGIGEVLLDKESVKDSISHGVGRMKSSAFAAVPKIIQDGIIIDSKSNWKERNYDSITIAAPITIAGERYIGVAVIKRLPNDKNRFYLHEVILQNNLLNDNIKTDTKAGYHQGDIAKVLQNIVSTKFFDKKVSKIVDDNGEPLVVAHSTNSIFTKFALTQKNDAGWLGKGFYFFGERSLDGQYGKNVMECFLNIREPYYISYEEMDRLAEQNDNSESETFSEGLKWEGYDGVYFNGNLNQEYVVFSPNQIKSATENESISNDPDIRFRAVKHGTGKLFTRFDHSKMGTGEGAQAYGWGTYVTDVEGIARSYANATYTTISNSQNISYLTEMIEIKKSLLPMSEQEVVFHRNQVSASERQVEKHKQKLKEYISKYGEDKIKHLREEYEKIKEKLDNPDTILTREEIGIYTDAYEIEDAERSIKTYEEIKNRNKSSLEELERSLEKKKNELAEYKEKLEEAKRRYARVVYDVEIPDPDGFNYLQWDENLTSMQAYAIRDALYDTILENDEDMMYYTSFEKKHLKQDIDMAFTDRIDGKTAYGTIQDYLGSPEAASKFLDSIGIIGMQYPAQYTTGGRSDGANNFVIYNENNAEIKDSVRFRSKDILSSKENSVSLQQKTNQLNIEQNDTIQETERNDGRAVSSLERRAEQGNSVLESAKRRIERRSGSADTQSQRGVRSESEERNGGIDREGQETLIEEWAKGLGLWHDEPTEEAESLYGEKIGSGAESYVYLKDKNTVVKVRDITGYNSLEEALESIAIHNVLFPKTAMTIMGFGRSDGELSIILEQPYIENATFATREQIAEYVSENFNAVLDESILGGHSYKNDIYLLQDLKPKNVLVDSNGDLFVIDGDFYYNPDSNNPDTRYRSLGRFSQDDTTRSLRFNGADRAIESFADRTHSVRIMQNDITKYLESNGFFDGMSERQRLDMLDTLDVATVIENIESAVEFEFSRYRDTLGKGLNDAVEQMSRLISRSGLNFIDPQGEKINSINVLKLYMIAKDNLEREDAVGMKEFILPTRGLQAFINETNTTWEGFVAQFESAIPAADIQNLWEQVKSVRKFTLDNLLGSGIITQEQYNDYITSDFYVPERGFMDEDIRKEYESKSLFGGSKKKGVDSKVNIKAKGGESLAGDVIESLHLLAADAINKSAQNKMRQKLFDILTNPNLERWREQLGIKTPVEMRLAYNPRTDKFVEVGRDLTLNEQKAVNKKLAELRSDLAAKTQQRNAYIRDYVIAERNGANDIVEERREQIEKLNEEISDIQTQLAGISTNEVDKSKGNERVDVYLNGIKHHMYMPNAHIADAINGVMYESGNVVKRVQSFTRTFANWLTTYNATFSVTNIQRDVARISAAGITEYGIKFEGKFIANFASPKLTRALGKYITTGEIDTNTEIGYYLEEFFKIGAHTGFTTLTRMEDLRKEIQSLSSESQRSVGKKLAKGTQKFLQLDKNSVLWRSAAAINTYAEYLTRFAAYMTVRDMGYSALEASRAAKNLSVNFNRKGKGNVLLSLTNMMIPFTNAAIQGATGYMRHFGGNNHTKNGVAATRALTFMTLIPMALGYMSYLLDPDDDEQEYLVPQYERENYFTLPLGIRWAYDEQLGAFSAIGANIAKWQKGYMTDSEFWSSNISLLSKRLLPAPSSIGESVESLIKIASGESDKTFSQVVSSLISIGFGGNILSVANNRTNFGGKVRTGIDGFAEYNASENAPLVYRDMAKWWAEFQGMDTEVGSILIKDDSVESGIREASDMENVNPREIETMLGYAPSAVMESIETAHAIARFIASDDPNKEEEFKKFWTGDSKFLNPKSVPLLNRLYKAHGTTEYQMIVKSESKKLAKKLNRHYNDWKKRQGLNATEEYTANEILKLEGYPTADSMDEVVRNATAYAELNYMIKAYENIEDAEKASEDINVMLDNIKLKRELIQAMRFYLSNEDKLYERAANNILNARDELGFRPVTPNAIDPYFDKDEEGKTMFQKRNEKREAEEEPETRAGKRLRSIKESF